MNQWIQLAKNNQLRSIYLIKISTGNKANIGFCAKTITPSCSVDKNTKKLHRIRKSIMLTICSIERNYSIKSLFNFLICKDAIIALRMLSVISENESLKVIRNLK